MKIFLSLTIESDEGVNLSPPKVTVRKTDSEIELRVASEPEESPDETNIRSTGDFWKATLPK